MCQRPKPLSKNQKSEGLPPLSEETPADLSSVLAEIWRLYRAARNGQMPPEKASKLVYVLREYRETQTVAILEKIHGERGRLATILERAGGK